MYHVTKDGSVISTDGKVIAFSFSRFVSDIVEGDRCFICGKDPMSTSFNDEHVLPDWILRRFNLHSRFIEIPNGTSFIYGSLKIPCCSDCNSLMGETFENPLREMFSAGYDGFLNAATKQDGWPLFIWMSLIFLKTHLKDKALRFHRDLRKPDRTIGQSYSWSELHHIHYLCRSFYTRSTIDGSVLGSLLILPAKTAPHLEPFDFVDLHLSQTMLLRIDDIAVLAVLNDSQMTAHVVENEVRSIEGPLSPLQLRELLAKLAFANLRLDPRPTFGSELDLFHETHKIYADRPQNFSTVAAPPEMFGYMLHKLCEEFLKQQPDPQLEENIKSGKWTFLVDSEGRFVADSMDLITESSSE